MFTLDTFYQSKTWIKLLEQLKLERVNEFGQLICEHCGKPITKKYDCIGHHIEKLTDDNVNDALISLNPENIKLIHFRCHNKIHQRFDGVTQNVYQNVYLVYGSPCAGKTTWVESVANPDDLIVDLDRLWEAVCTGGKYDKRNRLKANVFGLRDCLIDQIKCRAGMWRNAYIIGGYPLRSDRDRMCKLLRAKTVFINESKDVCLSRAINEDWKNFIEDWFENYTE